MPKIRVHELASKLGRSNREVIEFLKANGVEVKSHMSTLEEPSIRLIKQKFLTRGKEQITKVDNSRTEEKTVTARPEADKAEAPKKKKNIIRVYHAQNASDGGKNRPKRQNNNTDKRPAAKPQAQKPQAAQKPVEETAISVAAREDSPTAMVKVDRDARTVTETVREDRRAKVVRHVRVTETAVR